MLKKLHKITCNIYSTLVGEKKMGAKEVGTSGTSFSNNHFLPGDTQRQLVPLSLLLVGIHVHPKTQTCFRSTTSTKTRSNVNLALQRWEEEQETKKGEREVHVCIPLQKEEERDEREREIDSWVVTATFGFMAMGHTNRLIPEANSEQL